MTDKNKALEALADAYVSRSAAQDRVRAKYAQYERELAEAKQEDIDTVAQALVAALDAGASVASAGRAMGTANIYNSRRAYYNRARELQGEAAEEDNEFLERLYRQARGEEEPGSMQETAQLIVDSGVYTTDEPEDLRSWVGSWTLEETAPNNYTVHDPQERVDKIILGNIFGFAGKNATEFKDNAELHALVAEIHNIDMKEF